MMKVGELRPAFNFGFNGRLVRGGGSSGLFDESSTRQQIVVATDSNKLFLQSAESIFHLTEAISCVSTCRLSNEADGTHMSQPLDGVLVGTRNSLSLFDVYRNRTVFHREMPEGVNCLRVGTLDDHSDELVMCGCGTTIWGLRPDGSDVFWTALGDDINALELCDMDGDGRNEMIVGSNGTEIKVFKSTSLWAEYDEGDPCIALCAIGIGGFAFGLSSGVVGVYTNCGERSWRVKTKSQVAGLHSFPDASCVLCVWRNCKIDVRAADSGEILLKEQIGEGEVMDSFLCDINGTGNDSQLAVIFGSGQVRGFEISQGNDPSAGVKESEKLLREYGQRKHNLLVSVKCCQVNGERLLTQQSILHFLHIN